MSPFNVFSQIIESLLSFIHWIQCEDAIAAALHFNGRRNGIAILQALRFLIYLFMPAMDDF
jgi:hypothetical protein